MASYLRPRRGKKATATSQLTASNPLKRGEIFFEVPDTGVGTGTGKIKMGDGATAYASLPYFMVQPTVDYTNAVVAWTNTTAASSAPYTDNATYTNAIIPSASLKTIFTNLKKLLLNYNSQLTTLNNDLANINTDLNILKNRDRDITYEDYLALSDEEQSNGTTYFVTDLEGSGGASSSSNCTMKYDPVTDMIYIKDSEGNWHEFISGGLKQLILYEYGKINELVFGTFDFRGTGVFNENDVTVTGSGSYNSWYEIGLNSTLMIDVTKYSKLNVEYKSTISTNASANRLFFGFSTIKAENDTNSSFDASVSVEENTEGTVICDISDLNGVYYFKATDRFNTGGTSTITIKKIWLE